MSKESMVIHSAEWECARCHESYKAVMPKPNVIAGMPRVCKKCGCPAFAAKFQVSGTPFSPTNITETHDDLDHLKFIYERMVQVHGEKINIDYMLRFKNILIDMDVGRSEIKDLKALLFELFQYANKNAVSVGHGCKYYMIDLVPDLCKRVAKAVTGEGCMPDNDDHVREDCHVIKAQCQYFSYQCDSHGEVAISHCGHPKNHSEFEGNCTHTLCPLTGDASEEHA